MMEVWGLLRKNRGAMIGLAVAIFAILFAVFAPWIAPHDPVQVFPEVLRKSPFWGADYVLGFPMGTDDLGRDLLSRLIFGTRVSLTIGLLIVVTSTLIGTALGLLAGSLSGTKHAWVDMVISRAMDILMALPSILLAIVVVAILGPSFMNTILAVSLVSLPAVVRIVRSSVLVEKTKAYVTASKSFGSSWFRIFVIGVLPNCMAPLLVQATLGFSNGILDAAALGFLGLGAQPPTPEWGTMLSDARSYIESSPHLVTLPGLCILTVVLAFNLLGDGLRDALDPKIRKS